MHALELSKVQCGTAVVTTFAALQLVALHFTFLLEKASPWVLRGAEAVASSPADMPSPFRDLDEARGYSRRATDGATPILPSPKV